MPGQQFEYGHDDIGNRTSTKAGGDDSGAGLRPASYTPNNLNQYSSRTVPGGFDVIGLAMGNNSTLTVNSAAPWRKVEYFRKEVSVANSSAAAWQPVSVAATGEPTVNGNVFVPERGQSGVITQVIELIADMPFISRRTYVRRICFVWLH